MIPLESFLFGKLLIPTGYLLSKKTVLPILSDLHNNEHRSAAQITELQLRKLQRLVAHAYHNTPFYRQRFADIGAQPQDIRTLEDYARLPLLTRQELRDHRREMVATNFASNSLFVTSTGGSTGQPVNYHQDTRYAYSVAIAGLWREWSWAGIHPGDRHLYVWGGPREISRARGWRKRVQFSLLRRVFVDAFALSPAKLDWIIDEAQEFRPRFIYGYVSSVAAIARYLLDRQVKLAGIAAVMTTAERLLPEHRALLAEAFGCPLFDQYGCREVRSIASQCAHGSMHMETDLNVVEFVPDPGLPPQAPQRVVVTPLESYGLPLLRYVNDDLGTAAGPCDCGLPFPTMKLEFGRLSDNFLLPSGRLVHAQYFVTLVFGTSGIRQFQFRQTAPDHFLFKVVWEHAAAADKTRPLLRRMIAGAEAYLGEGCEIELQEVEQIPLTASGKYRYVISDIMSGGTSVPGAVQDSQAGASDRPVGN